MSVGSQKIFGIILCWPWHSWLVSFVMLSCAEVDFGSDTIFQGQRLEGWQVLSSSNKAFTLRFFSFNTSVHRYLGIFLSGEDAQVWIANRNNPINDTSGAFMINGTDGMLNIIHSGGYTSLPTTLSTGYRNINTSATLRNDGNLVLSQVHPNGSPSGKLLWQSFDYPTDTLLPGMKLGSNLRTGHQWSLTSSMSDQLFSSGSFTLGVDRNSTNQLILYWHQKVFWTSRLWQKDSLGNLVPHAASSIMFEYVSNENENYFTYTQTTEGAHTAIRLTPIGKVIVIPVNNELVSCDLSVKDPKPGCNINYYWPECMKGNYSLYNTTARYDFDNPFSIKEDYNNLSITDCQAKCMQNCSCSGYVSLYENGTGCEYFLGEDANQYLSNLIDYESSSRRIIYFHITTSSTSATVTKRNKSWLIWSIPLSASGPFWLLLSIYCMGRKCKTRPLLQGII